MSTYDTIALACQGGGSLGAYHIGAYQALEEQGYIPTIFSGISIGAFTAAILAGNAPEDRLPRLREFWQRISWPDFQPTLRNLSGAETTYNWFAQTTQNYWSIPTFSQSLAQLSSMQAFLFGQPNFFMPRQPGPEFQQPGTVAATSYYDTSPVRDTLLELVDFDRINRGESHLFLGATKVKEGSLIFFDSQDMPLGPEHVIASGSMPPGFPGIEIDGDLYWDGGCVSNTPLDGLFEALVDKHSLVIMVDLFGADGKEPTNMREVNMRQKEILYASRSQYGVDQVMQRQMAGAAMQMMLNEADNSLLSRLNGTEMPAEVQKMAKPTNFDLIQVIYRPGESEIATFDCEFSRTSIERRADVGLEDMRQALTEATWLKQEPVPVTMSNGKAKSRSLKAGGMPIRMPHMHRYETVRS